MEKKVINAALLGLGTVGTGVYKVLKAQREEMEAKLGGVVEIKKIMVRNLEKAAAIGLIPEELLDRAKAVGNSSLGGAAVWLTEPGAAERMERIIAVSEEIPLASDKDFNQFYMDSMFFEV